MPPWVERGRASTSGQRFEPGGGEEGGAEVDEFDEVVPRLSAGYIRACDDEGDVDRGLVRGGLPPSTVVAEHLAVVGAEDHEGAIGLPAGVDAVEDAADPGVEVATQRGISAADGLMVVTILGARGVDRIGEGDAVVEVGKLGGRVEWLVRAGEVGPEEPGGGGVDGPVLEELEGLDGGEAVGVGVAGEGGGVGEEVLALATGDAAVPVGDGGLPQATLLEGVSPEVLRGVAADVDGVALAALVGGVGEAELGDIACPAVDALGPAVGDEVGLAGAGGAVARVAEALKNGGGAGGVELLLVPADGAAVVSQPGGEAGACGCAEGAVGAALGEGGAAVGESVEVGRADGRVAVGGGGVAQPVPTPLVGEEEEEVGRVGHAISMKWPRCGGFRKPPVVRR